MSILAIYSNRGQETVPIPEYSIAPVNDKTTSLLIFFVFKTRFGFSKRFQIAWHNPFML